MSETPPSRTGRFGAIFVAVVVAGSAVGVLGWHLLSNRDAGRMDNAGFDLAETPDAERPAAAPAPRPPAAAPQSSLGTFKADAGIQVAEGGAQKSGASPLSAAQRKKEESRQDFAKTARKYEGTVRGFAERMTAKNPLLQQYGREWMSYPDLKKLNDDFMRDKDPVKFLLGASQSENFGKMVKKYARAPEIREFVIQAFKETPTELKASALGVLDSDRLVKDVVSGVAKSILPALPPSVLGAIESGDPGKIDASKLDASKMAPSKVEQNKVVNDLMNNPELKKVMQQGAPPAAVNSGQ